jgi:starch-binding outer membrane protein, SusD/RagB family
MKQIRINTAILASLILMLLAACSKDFITIQPKGQFLTQNYYTNRDQAYSGLVAVYDLLRKNAGGFENMITMMNAGSDDNYAGGGGASDGAGIQGFSNYTLNLPAFGAIITRVYSGQIFY